MTKQQPKKVDSKDKRIKELEEKLLYAEAENAYLKALRDLSIQENKKPK